MVITYRSEPPGELETRRHTLIAKRCDVTLADEVEQLFSEVEAELGTVEVLVFSAGMTMTPCSCE